MNIDENSKIGWMIHTYGPIDPSVYSNHMGVVMNWVQTHKMCFLGLDGDRTADARNILINTAQEIGCTHVLVIDSDHILPVGMLDALCNCEGEIVSGLITRRKPPYAQVGFIKNPKGEGYLNVNIPIDGRSYFVDIPAMGCTLIDIKVFDKLEKPYFRDTSGLDLEGNIYNRRSDFNFFKNCGELGFKMVIDTRIQVGHLMDKKPMYPSDVPTCKELNKEDKIRNVVDSLKWQTPVYNQELNKKPKYVLDLGCGNPTKVLNKYGDIAEQITLVDYPNKLSSITDVVTMSKVSAKIYVLGKDLCEDFELSNKFDLVFASDVFEHLEKPKVFFNTIRHNITKDGILILSTPEASSTKNKIHNALHVVEYTKDDMLKVFDEEGFVVEESFSYEEGIKTKYINNVFICKLKE